MNINFDMDGTLVDFYSVSNWLEDLENSNPRPYKIAKPLVNLSVFAKQVNRLQAKGYKINIISWLSKGGEDTFNNEVIKEKNNWLKKHLPSVHFDCISIIKYGTPKSNYGEGILFDDEERNRQEWHGIAFNEKEMLDTLKKMQTRGVA